MNKLILNELQKWFPELSIKNISPQTFTRPNYDEDIDSICQRQLVEINQDIKDNKSFDIFLMPLSLNENLTELTGLVLAHHIRLSKEFSFCEKPIVFYGYIDLEQVLKLSPLARILLTDRVHYINLSSFNDQNIAGFKEKLKQSFNKEFSLQGFLNQIEIQPPPNYDTHHSIDNEFALIHWSKYIGCYEQLPEYFKKEFDSRLYFKYLLAKKPVKEIIDKKQFSILCNQVTNVLLIDDEWNKGWKEFYKSFYEHSPNIKFQSIEIDFINTSQDKLIRIVEERAIEHDADIVLIDLRLVDSDFDEKTAPENLTGIKVIEAIKNINKGIQIIVTTASNKAWNFRLAREKGAYDFIIKDRSGSPYASILQLKKVTEECSKRACILKKIYKLIS
ncbi:MAG: response regulator, partial [Ignavibacterium sp.]|nr:response regulator [Ignavibacterium sp.]MDW8375745.1 response regulator [Ignavibacteriales bacterium]